MFIFQLTASFDETTTLEDVDKLFKVFAGGKSVCGADSSIVVCLVVFLFVHYTHAIKNVLVTCQVPFTAASLASEVQDVIPSGLVRETPYLTHPIFNS